MRCSPLEAPEATGIGGPRPAMNLAYPAVMIPAFSAPLSLALHGLSLRQLARASRQESGPAAALAY